MASQVVEDDDVAWLERGEELLVDPGVEARAVDGTVEDAWRGESIATQGGDEDHGAPASVRGKAVQPLASGVPTAKRGHVGLHPRLIDEDQPGGIEIGHEAHPAPPPAGDIGAGAFNGE